jgi:hypothetical protein
MKISITLLLSGFLMSFANAQENDDLFKVLASKGSNKIIASGSTEEKPLVIGKKLHKDDVIVLSENGYLGLAHKNGKTIELKKTGTLAINELASEVASQNATLTKKYVDFVIGEISVKNDNMAENRHKFMAVTGSVERGSDLIKIIGPDNKIDNFVLARPTTFRWNKVADVRSYAVRIENMFGDSLYAMETADTSVTLELGPVNKKNENTVNIIKVKGKRISRPATAPDFSLKFIGGEKGAKLNKEIEDLKIELGEESALNNLVLASFYEEKKLLIDAMESYEKAIKMQPEVEDYKVLYGQFLVRTHIAEEKKQ